MTNNERHDTDILSRADALRESVIANFPALSFRGEVTPVDGEWTRENTEDEKALYETLKGRSWKQVPPEFVNSHPDGLNFVTDKAFCCFLPAWLLQTLQNLDGENEVRDFAVYMFNPKHEGNDPPAMIFRRLALLSPEQRKVARSFMEFFSEAESSGFVRTRAARAVSRIDEGS